MKLILEDDARKDVLELAEMIGDYERQKYINPNSKEYILNNIVVGEIATREFIHGFNTALMMCHIEFFDGKNQIDI
ncbi:MAG: hypothetical protein EOM87_04370 [Clostridia bacterium]|nr:hypothetical protein [Clostridia bacterium]